ncbi:zinc finger protein ZFP2-like isoform X1 [Musca domestica]|uniref:Zinc finger protein ZFP2-like isoform X1 n=1 Tax=Musca domestica TaxID=7370 RepID=A0ABM3V3E7_MUSDO|nr:zinc finger protein ZFP2-like isoform X1 [Musca domestica]
MSSIPAICRTCLDPEGRYFQISDYVDESLSIIEILDVIVPQIRIMEEKHSEFAPLICEECLEKLLQSYRFQQLCIDADNQLRKLFEEDAESQEMQMDTKTPIEFLVDEKNDVKVEIEYVIEGSEVKDIVNPNVETCIELANGSNEEETEEEHVEVVENTEEIIDILESNTPPISDTQHFCRNCDKKFESLSCFKAHCCSKPVVRSLFNCEMCHITFPNEKTYKAHILEHEEEENNNINVDNNENVLGEDEVEVDIDQLITKEAEEEHLKEDTAEEEVGTETIIDNWSDLNDNSDEYTITNEQNSSAGDCEEALIEKASDKNRRNCRYPCEVCGKIYDRISRLQRHSRVHSLHKKYECEICKARFSTASYLKIHQDKHLQQDHANETPPPGGYKCPDCPRRFEKLTALSGHRRSHSDKQQITKKLLCNYCQRKFLSEKTLTEHIRNKHPDEKYMCDQCDRTFVLHSKLIEHLSVHRELICDICQKEFAFESLLKEHMRTHSGECPFLCPQCGKTFKCGGNLRQHIERHSTVKRHACPSCSRRFKCRTDLKKHMSTHQGVKNYVCDICGIRFTRAFSMEQHKRLHMTSKLTHSCDLCNMSFNTETNLKRHVQQVHPNENGN